MRDCLIVKRMQSITSKLLITMLLITVFGKILERLIFNSLFEFLHENNLLLMRINQDSDHLTHVNISSYQLYMTHIKGFCKSYKIKFIGVTGLPLSVTKQHGYQLLLECLKGPL